MPLGVARLDWCGRPHLLICFCADGCHQLENHYHGPGLKNGPDFYYDLTDGCENESDPYRQSENGLGCYPSNGYGCGLSHGYGFSNGWELGLERGYDYDSPYDPDLHFGYDGDEPA